MSTLEQLKEKNQALEQRVEKLEQRFENPPVSRRAAIAGGAGLVGLSALSGSASAGSNQVGTIGSSSDRVDIFADDIDANQLTGVSTIKTKTRAFLSSNSSADPIPLDAVSFDPDSNFDTSSHEYTVPATGTYLVTFNIRLNVVSIGSSCSFTLRRNGNQVVRSELVAEEQFSTTAATDIGKFSSGDIITLRNDKVRALRGNSHETFLTISRLE
jgi:hypothetical protein